MTNEELKHVIGGINITGTFLNSIYRAVNSFMDVGRSLGSAIRRIGSGRMCPIN
jgi:hypothetical protein